MVLEDSDPQQALDAFAQAAKLEPNNPEPHLSAGQLLEKQNQLDAAAKEYEAAMALDPKSIEPAVALSVVYTRQQKYPQAEAMLRKLLDADPQNQTVRTQLGRILAAEGKADEAAKELGAGDGKCRRIRKLRWTWARSTSKPGNTPRRRRCSAQPSRNCRKTRKRISRWARR